MKTVVIVQVILAILVILSLAIPLGVHGDNYAAMGIISLNGLVALLFLIVALVSKTMHPKLRVISISLSVISVIGLIVFWGNIFSY
jgi:hypothetical protein